MKFLFVVIIMLDYLLLYGQRNENCKILDAFLKNENAKKVFGLEEYKDVPITIIDVYNSFDNCQVQNYYGRKVEIVSDSSYVEIVNSSNILVYNVTKRNRRYIMYVHFKLRQAFGNIDFKKRKDDFIVKKFSIGNF